MGFTGVDDYYTEIRWVSENNPWAGGEDVFLVKFTNKFNLAIITFLCLLYTVILFLLLNIGFIPKLYTHPKLARPCLLFYREHFQQFVSFSKLIS